MRIIPEYREAWLDLMERYDGWRFEDMLDDEGHPVTIPVAGGGRLPVRFMIRKDGLSE